MSNIYFADIETTKFKDKYQEMETYYLDFILGCCISFESNSEINKKIICFNEIEFCEKLKSLGSFRKKAIIYFHNLGFDSKFLLNYLKNKFDKVKIINSGSSIISIKFMNKYKKSFRTILELRDSLSILVHTSIKQLGSYLKVNKLDIEFINDYKDKFLYQCFLIQYCIRDCEIIYRALQKFCNIISEIFKFKFELSDLRLTIASNSKMIFERFYNNVFYKNNEYIETNFRKFFYGGRTECFNFNMLSKAKYLDVNSLYPFVLSYFKFCTDKIEIINVNQKIKDKEIINDKNIVGFTCIIKENQFYPLYPLRIAKKVLFPNGIKHIFMSRLELKYLLENNYIPSKLKILKVNKLVYCTEQLNFSKYFIPLANRKAKEKGIIRYIVKICMNSPYGKFGQNPNRKERNIMSNLSILDNINSQEQLDKLNLFEIDDVFYQIKDVFNSNQTCNLINAILTTNYARFELWKQLEYNRKNKIENYYSDSDSIVVKDSNTILNKLKSIIHESELGKWKIEQNMLNFQAIDSKEYFYFDKDDLKNIKIKLKGLSTKNLDKYLPNNEKLEKIKLLELFYKEGVLTHRITSILSCINRNIDLKTAEIFKKQKHSYYYKRIIDKNSLKTNPINITKHNINKIKIHNEKILKKLLDNIF